MQDAPRVRFGAIVAGLALFAIVASGASEAVAQAAPPPAGSRLPLPARIDAVTASSPLDRVHWGILVFDPATGDTIYSRNAQLPFVPASNMKIPVTYGAMALLGPEYRWDTAFWARVGSAQDATGVFDGDIVLSGTGDPTLGEPFHPSAEEALEALAGSLAAAGIRGVDGTLIVDVAAWDSTSVPSAWMVGNLPSRSAATGGAFVSGAGEIVFEITGSRTVGEPAAVSWRPLGSDDFIESRIVTGAPGTEADVRASYLPESQRWILDGTLAPGARISRTHAVRDPVRQSVSALTRALSARGIEFRDGVRIVWEPDEPLLGGCAASRVPRCPEAVRIAGLPSPSLVEVTRAIMEPSQNWMTEQLVRTLGAELGEGGSWREGFDVLTTFLVEELAVDSLEIHWRDGSGLSAYNLISPRAVVRILDDARSRHWFPLYRSAQAEPGRENSTLRTRLVPLAGRLYAKTGSISHVNSLSGYLVRDDGSEVIFSILTNTGNLPAAQVRAAIDEVVMEISRP